MSESERRLAAIMFTDMAGYTALGQENEHASLELLERHRQLLRPLFSKHAGREIKTMGDAFLVEFHSALEATLCAIDIQSTVHSRNLERGERLQVRVGIHVGDVVHQGNDVLGDAVNIASRIEPLAMPGGICLSEQVHDQIRNKVPYQLVKIQTGALKNVRERFDVYKVVLPWDRSDAGAETSPRLDRRRVAVLPFVNISPDPADEYFADGMTEELISTMSRIRGLSVIARTSVMGYKGGQKKISDVAKELEVGTVLEGSVRRAGDRLRITVQLIDSQTSGHRWAESYDRELRDIFAIQSDVASRVAGSISAGVFPKAPQKDTDDAEAYTFYIRGIQLYHEESEPSLREAVTCFEHAISRDPAFARAYAGLAHTWGRMAMAGYEDFGHPREG